MKKHTAIALVLYAWASSIQAYDLSDKFYAGFSLGPTIPRYKANYIPIGQANNKPNILSFNVSANVGKTFTNYGFEVSLSMLNFQRYKETYNVPITGQTTTRYTAFDVLFAGDFIYYIPASPQLSFKLIIGVGALESLRYTTTKSQIATTSSSSESNFKLTPKAGIGLRYALSDNISTTCSLNYAQPIDHAYLKRIIYANLGVNIHFS